MTTTPEISKEEAFDFPRCAGLINHEAGRAYATRYVRRVYDSKPVMVDMPGTLMGEKIIYEYATKSENYQATLLRGAWIRPREPVDVRLPIRVQVLVDNDLALDQPFKAHLWGGSPVPLPCVCNRWNMEKICACQVAPLVRREDSYLFSANALDGQLQAFAEKPLGVFGPDGTILRVRLVNDGRKPFRFQARCGITAALYSTKESDCS